MKKRLAQTTVEYILITLVLVVIFVILHKALQWAVAKQFESSGIMILRVYKENY